VRRFVRIEVGRERAKDSRVRNLEVTAREARVCHWPLGEPPHQPFLPRDISIICDCLLLPIQKIL
jgi:hypothetical protein